MMVRVTQADINRSRPIANCCPIALALGSSGMNDTRIGVTREFIRIGEMAYVTPIIATRFMRAYDRGEVVEPFEFELDLTKLFRN